MYWNYRVFRHVNNVAVPTYYIHEVYYDDNGKVASWTVDPVNPQGDTEEELRNDLRFMLAACDEKTLDDRGFPVADVGNVNTENNE